MIGSLRLAPLAGDTSAPTARRRDASATTTLEGLVDRVQAAEPWLADPRNVAAVPQKRKAAAVLAAGYVTNVGITCLANRLLDINTAMAVSAVSCLVVGTLFAGAANRVMQGVADKDNLMMGLGGNLLSAMMIQGALFHRHPILASGVTLAVSAGLAIVTARTLKTTNNHLSERVRRCAAPWTSSSSCKPRISNCWNRASLRCRRNQ